MTLAAQKKAKEMGATGFFQKPIDAESIKIVLEKYRELYGT